MIRKHYFASATIKKDQKEVMTITVTGWDWFWVSSETILQQVKEGFGDYCDKNLGKDGWDGIHVTCFSRI